MKRVSRRALTRLRGNAVNRSEKVPGPSPDPSSNLVMADVAIWMGSYLVRRMVERRFLSGRYGKQIAKDIVRNRSIGQRLATMAIARFATGSLPGAAIVTSGMAAKVLMDRSKARHVAQVEGDVELLHQARGE
jgi:hypothetical protein